MIGEKPPSWIENGECCCNCKHQVKIVSHPWINNFPSSHQLFWGCAGFLFMDKDSVNEVSIAKKHGFCELYERVPGTKKCKVDTGT